MIRALPQSLHLSSGNSEGLARGTVGHNITKMRVSSPVLYQSTPVGSHGGPLYMEGGV